MTDYRHESGDEAERYIEHMKGGNALFDILALVAIFSVGIGIYIVVAA